MTGSALCLIRFIRELILLASLGREYLRLGGSRLWDQAAAVQAPTLVVWGGRDQIRPVELAPRLAATIPDAWLSILDDVAICPTWSSR